MSLSKRGFCCYRNVTVTLLEAIFARPHRERPVAPFAVYWSFGFEKALRRKGYRPFLFAASCKIDTLPRHDIPDGFFDKTLRICFEHDPDLFYQKSRTDLQPDLCPAICCCEFT